MGGYEVDGGSCTFITARPPESGRTRSPARGLGSIWPSVIRAHSRPVAPSESPVSGRRLMTRTTRVRNREFDLADQSSMAESPNKGDILINSTVSRHVSFEEQIMRRLARLKNPRLKRIGNMASTFRPMNRCVATTSPMFAMCVTNRRLNG